MLALGKFFILALQCFADFSADNLSAETVISVEGATDDVVLSIEARIVGLAGLRECLGDAITHG